MVFPTRLCTSQHPYAPRSLGAPTALAVRTVPAASTSATPPLGSRVGHELPPGTTNCAQNRVKLRRRCGMKCWRDVTVDIERGPDRAVAEHLLNHLWVHADRQ